MYDGIFVLVVDFDSEEFFDALRRPHFDRIPGHPFTDVDADLTADALVKSDLHVGDDDVYAVGRVTRRMLDAIDRTEAHARLAACAIVGDDDCNLLRLLFLARDFARSLGDD